MKISAVAPWFGSKRMMAEVIIKQIGPHSAYWEPFCGSMAILMAKAPCRMETVNDLHGDLINLARVIRDERAGAMLYRRLRRVLASQDTLRQSRDVLLSGPGHATELDVVRAEHYFVNSWLGMNGIAGTLAGEDGKRGIARRFSSDGGDSPTRFESAVESIPDWRRRMRGVMILNDDALEIISRIEDKEGTVIYADPPYVEKSESYRHDFADADHQRLAELFSRFKRTRVIVSYYDHPTIDALYQGWTKIDCTRTKVLANASKQSGGKVSPEILLINGPSFVDDAPRSLFD